MKILVNIDKYRWYIGNHEYMSDISKISALNGKKSLKFWRYIGYIGDISIKNQITINKLILIIL